MRFIGIDIGSEKHVVAIVDDEVDAGGDPGGGGGDDGGAGHGVPSGGGAIGPTTYPSGPVSGRWRRVGVDGQVERAVRELPSCQRASTHSRSDRRLR